MAGSPPDCGQRRRTAHLTPRLAFAEFSIAYPHVEAAQADLNLLHIFYDPITPAAAYLAGQIFLRYRRNGGPRLNLIPDFLIAALDRGYLRSYFPSLVLLGNRMNYEG